MLRCRPGAKVTASCQSRRDTTFASVPSQAVRICESSVALGSGTACEYEKSLAQSVIPDVPSGHGTTGPITKFTFTCPAARDSVEVGGYFSLYTAPFLPTDAAASVTCTFK